MERESKGILGAMIGCRLTWRDTWIPPWLTNRFLSLDDTLEEARTKIHVLILWLVGLVAVFMYMLLRHTVSFMTEGETEGAWMVADIMSGYAALLFVACLFYMHLWGLTRFLKVFFILNSFCWLTVVAVFDSVGSWHVSYILILDFCLVVHSDQDEALLEGVSILMRVAVVVYVSLHVLSVSDLGPNIHWMDYGWSQNPITQFSCVVIPTLLNFAIFRSYLTNARRDARVVHESVELASRIAAKLVNFDLDSAAELLERANSQSPIHQPLSGLLRNLRGYQPFLPEALFHSKATHDAVPPNEALANAMSQEKSSLEHVRRAVKRLRDPGYSLWNYHEDVEAAFPELKLYKLRMDGSSVCSSGLSGSDEYQRTLGAFYSLYCMARLDIDGKEIFSFGVDQQWMPRRSAHGAAKDRMRSFFRTMEWDKVKELLIRAGILNRDNKFYGGLKVDSDRATAFLVLTAIHDVMKNSFLLPIVQKGHAPFEGVSEGCPICDHDFALSYIMEKFPSLLPSFQMLEPGQRAPVLFAHSKMGFNNGWLVQGEAPPGPLFSQFKKVIVQGRAAESDIDFYFVHWLTDLAGAEPFGDRPWPGSEKFVLKFPQQVLVAFLDSFTYVDHLATKTEVQVMEEYLRSRWAALGPPVEAVEEGCELAAARVALMAQGFEAQAVKAFLRLPESERNLVAAEMARTGLRLQFDRAPPSIRTRPTGPAFLVYYAPALIQKAGPDHALEALRVLAAVYRAARDMFPAQTRTHAVEQTVVVKIDALKVLSPAEIGMAGSWHLRRTAEFDLEAVCSAKDMSEAPKYDDSINLGTVPIEIPDFGDARRLARQTEEESCNTSRNTSLTRRAVAL